MFSFDSDGNLKIKGIGAQGAQGAQGFQGRQGNQGRQGFQGPADGFQGAQGNQGSPGASLDPTTTFSQYDDFTNVAYTPGVYVGDTNELVIPDWHLHGTGSLWNSNYGDGDSYLTNLSTEYGNHPGILCFGPSSSADTHGLLCKTLIPTTGLMDLSNGDTAIEWVIKKPNTNKNSVDVTDVANYYFGLLFVNSGSPPSVTDGIYFRYDKRQSDNWIIGAMASSTATETDTGTPVDDNWHRLTIVSSATGTAPTVEYFLDGVSKGTINTNVPTTFLDPSIFVVTYNSFSTGLAPVLVDYFFLNNTMAVTR